MRFFRLAAHQPKADFAPFYLRHHRHAIRDGCGHPDMRVLLAENRQKDREKVFTWDRTRRQEQFTDQWRHMAGDFPTNFPMKFENTLGELVDLLARLGEQNSPTLSLE